MVGLRCSQPKYQGGAAAPPYQITAKAKLPSDANVWVEAAIIS
jgi:hypothetical protein